MAVQVLGVTEAVGWVLSATDNTQDAPFSNVVQHSVQVWRCSTQELCNFPQSSKCSGTFFSFWQGCVPLKKKTKPWFGDSAPGNAGRI